MTVPSQSTEFTLDSGLKIQSFRRDPSKFFVEMESWMRNLKVGSIEKMAITGDGAGYMTLVIAYREKDAALSDRQVLNDTLGLLLDVSAAVTQIVEKVYPKKNAVDGSTHPGNAPER